ncbi:probable oxidoreductase PXDNL isoform X2 [Bos indicus]|uniref:Probable oxidoreductase PXDNL isoform X2 n=1 Tax=Bos indicus TaxID=9915 RepID=A0ABM4TF02_BOSIN
MCKVGKNVDMSSQAQGEPQPTVTWDKVLVSKPWSVQPCTGPPAVTGHGSQQAQAAVCVKAVRLWDDVSYPEVLKAHVRVWRTAVEVQLLHFDHEILSPFTLPGSQVLRLRHVACGFLSPWPGMGPSPTLLDVQS